MPDLIGGDTNNVLEYMINDGIITHKEIGTWPEMEHDTRAVYQKIVEHLQSLGYDGIVYKNFGEDRLAQRARARPEGEIPINPADVLE